MKAQLNFCKLAVTEIEAGNWEAKGRHINRAIDIINELNTVLDMEAGGEIAQNLRRLYAFMVRHLGQANMKRDPKMIQEVIELLTELNEGWKAVTYLIKVIFLDFKSRNAKCKRTQQAHTRTGVGDKPALRHTRT